MVENMYKTVPIEENEEKIDLKEDPPKYGFGMRHIQSVLTFSVLCLGYLTRGHLGVTIVAMVDSHVYEGAHELINITNAVNVTERFDNNTMFDENLIANQTIYPGIYRTYNWPKSTQEMVLGSFFLGYCIMMFPMGMVCQRWGGKVALQIAMLANGVLSILSPWLISWGDWKILCVIRVMQGLTQSGLYPATVFIISSWIPVSERASLSSIIFTGSGVGTIIAFQLGGILGFSEFGWPSTFWMSGVLCIISFILITIFGASSPNEHKSISESEKNYILGGINENAITNRKVPWKAIFTSVPAWATFITHTGNAIAFIYIFIQVPTYMHSILKLDIRSSGVLSSLPYIASFFSSVAFGFSSDYLTNRHIMSVKNARKLSNSIGSVIPALCITLVSYTRNTLLATTCFVVCAAANAAVHTGWFVNYVDLSPNYSGSLMAIGNTLTNIISLGLPIMVSNIVTDVTNQGQWRITMILVAAVTVTCNMIFVIFMSSDLQPWNSYHDPITNGSEDIQLKSEEKSKEVTKNTDTEPGLEYNNNKISNITS